MKITGGPGDTLLFNISAINCGNQEGATSPPTRYVNVYIVADAYCT